MVNLNKTLPRTWFPRFALVLATAATLGISSIAAGQYFEPGAHSDWYQPTRYASSCGYENCAPAFAGCRGGNCRLANYVSGVRNSTAILRHRELPTGNMGLHFPYQANQMYYYRRPYNSFHVPTHVGESRNSSAQSSFGESLGYSNQIFEQVHESSEQYHNAVSGGATEKDGLLEFVDWTEHRQSRLNWEATPRYHSEHSNGSYPYLNEEVKNRRSNDYPATALRQRRPTKHR